MHKLVAGTGLVLGDVLQVDGLLQEDLPLDLGPVVSLNCVDHLNTQTPAHKTLRDEPLRAELLQVVSSDFTVPYEHLRGKPNAVNLC